MQPSRHNLPASKCQLTTLAVIVMSGHPAIKIRRLVLAPREENLETTLNATQVALCTNCQYYLQHFFVKKMSSVHQSRTKLKAAGSLNL